MKQLCSFSAGEIQRLLPHRYPFFFLDSAFDIEPGVSGRGTKLFTMNEWFFVGHFPGEPIVPGVLEIQALAQLTAVVYVSRALVNEKGEVAVDLLADRVGESKLDLPGRVGYLAKANVKFTSVVKPGMTLDLSVRVKRSMGPLSIVSVTARVGSKETSPCPNGPTKPSKLPKWRLTVHDEIGSTRTQRTSSRGFESSEELDR